METARFTAAHLEPPALSGIDVVTKLRHFAIVTYAVPVRRVQPHVDRRFALERLESTDGESMALVSVVPFLDVDFRSARYPSPRLSFGQTNYRTYVRDMETGVRGVWFFGTCLDSWTVVVPRHLWKLPWHRGRIRFDCEVSPGTGRYRRYSMTTRSRWAPAALELEDTGEPTRRLPGFEDLETGLVILTHPLDGYFCRRDGRLGTYRIWHDRLDTSRALCRNACFPLLDELGVVPLAEQAEPHSVMLQRETVFQIHLPPRRLGP